MILTKEDFEIVPEMGRFLVKNKKKFMQSNGVILHEGAVVASCSDIVKAKKVISDWVLCSEKDSVRA
jgi:hypothetical protein